MSAISGNPVTGQVAGISGRVSADGGTQAVVAGTLSEVNGGQYRLNMFANDTSGNNLGFLFTASGCVPVSFNVITDNNVSGRIGIVSGTSVNVWSGQLSGHAVNVISGNLSGQIVTAASGMFGTASLNSGQFTIPYSGQMSGQAVNLLSGNQTQVWSGTFVNVFSGQLSGQQINAASGNLYLASGSLQHETFASGILSGTIPRNVLGYDFTAMSGFIASGVSGRCLLQAARKLINKFDTAAQSGRLVVYQEDDVQIAYRQNITEVSGANPITSLDTV